MTRRSRVSKSEYGTRYLRVRSGILVYGTTDPGSAGSIPGNGRKHPRTDPVLRIVERDPLGIHVVYTGIWIQSRNQDHRRPFRGLLQKVTKGASILGMFVLGALIERWVSINFTPVVSTVQLSDGAYIDWNSLPSGAEGIQTALQQYASGLSLTPEKVTTLQDNLNSLIPGFVPLLLTLLCMWLLKKNVSPDRYHHRPVHRRYRRTCSGIIIRKKSTYDFQKKPGNPGLFLYPKINWVLCQAHEWICLCGLPAVMI